MTLREQRDDIMWAAGFLEGEGFVYSRKNSGTLVFAANQVERWPVDRLVKIFGGRISLRKPQNNRWQPQWHWESTGPRAVGIALTLFSLLSPKRRSQIAAALANWRLFPAHASVRNSCANGHAYTEENTRHTTMFGKPAHRCRICNAASHLRWVRRQKAQGPAFRLKENARARAAYQRRRAS